MGDIADMMLEGDLCCDCGVYLPGSGDGSPRRCRDCRRDQIRQRELDKVRDPNSRFHAICPTCKKRVKLSGLADHTKAAHGR